ncbi:MAG: hypothetical protein ACYS0G_01185 [Planctomycetota bacterium]|jgi:hypothetical protein
MRRKGFALGRKLRICAAAALVAAAMLLAGGVALWRLSLTPPTWWAPPDPADTRVTALADRLEYRLTAEAHKIRPGGEPWRVDVSEGQVNAWLTARLPEWAAHTHDVPWPKRLDPPQLRFEQEGISIGLELPGERGHRVVVARVLPRFTNGQLVLNMERFSVGRLWIPGGPAQKILDHLEGDVPGAVLNDPNLRRALELLTGERPLDPTMTLSDGRRVRLLEMHHDNQTIGLVCETAGVGKEGTEGLRGRGEGGG